MFHGSRLVSLPFSDHYEPHLGAGEDLGEFANLAASDRWRYVELRPLHAAPSVKPGQSGFREGEGFWFHRLDLSPSAEERFCHFHPDCVRRKIRGAEREHVAYEEGRSPALLDSTRRRQRLPPQPRICFRNLVKFLGESH